MPSPIQIPLNESQKNLLQSKELTIMVEPEIKSILSAIVSQGEKNSLHINPMNLEHLIDMISNVTDYEVHNPKLAKRYVLLADYLTDFLEKQ